MSIAPFVRRCWRCYSSSSSAAAFAQISISVSFAPPELPVYEQHLYPGDGYLWTPGYWAYAGDHGYSGEEKKCQGEKPKQNEKQQ